MLSVIVCIYNVEQYLSRCIESILNQKYKNLEILLIDDGSTDCCPRICDRYKKLDKRVRVFHKKNEGLVKARKTGLINAYGEYVGFVDGDDYIDADMYLELMKVLCYSNADFVDSNFFYDVNGEKYENEKKGKGVYILNQDIRHKLFLSLFGIDNFINITPSIWSKIFKREIVKEAYSNVPDTMQYGEDVINLIHCILKSNEFIQVEKTYYYYNCRENSMSHFKSISYVKDELMLWDYCGNLIIDNDDLMTKMDIDELLHRRLYSALGYLKIYIFPYIDRLLNKRVVLYGAGKVGRDYFVQIELYKKCEIVSWVDKNFEMIPLNYYTVKDVDSILQKEFDIVLLAVEKKEIANEIEIELLIKGISKEKIIWHRPITVL